MFTGDSSGDWLYEALYRFGFANQPVSVNKDDGLDLNGCLITAALRCAPPNNKPLPEEMNNCRKYLRQELQLTKDKRIVVVLGRIAFQAFLKACQEAGQRLPDQKLQFSHGGEWILPGKIALISSFHPSRQNTQTGKLTRPRFHDIFGRARKILDEQGFT